MMIGIAELLRDHRQPSEGVADHEFVAHSHAAMELDRFLADMPAGIGDPDLRRGDHPPSRCGIGFGIDVHASHAFSHTSSGTPSGLG
jgi:hypothetical protein